MKKLYVWMITAVCSIISVLYSVTASAQTQNVKEVEERLLKQAAENIEMCRKGDAVIRFITASGDPVRNAKVEVKQTKHDFLFGGLTWNLINERNNAKLERGKQMYKELFNFAVFELYWKSTEPELGKAEKDPLFPMLEWCEANDITTKGHALVWPCRSGVPKWLGKFTLEETEVLLKARIINITDSFEGRIDIWDVVNEPVNVWTWRNKVKNLDTERDWGKEEPIQDVADYVDLAFKWTYQANPRSELVLNEYYQISNMKVRERFYELVKELQKRGTPLHGLGIQAHEPRKGQEWYNPRDVWDTYDYLGSLGLPLHITEIMTQSSGKEITGGWRTGTWTEEAQADFAEQFYRLSFGHPSMMSIGWWGFADYIGDRWPNIGLVTVDYDPKPVYNRLKKLIHEEWETNLSTPLNRKGELEFRGFFGNYDIVLHTADGKVRTFTVHLSREEENRWVFTVE